MPDVRFDTYYRFDELTRILQAYAAECPQLVRLESMGHSYEGRALWVLTLTNFATGPAEQKPAFWADGNIHASEVSGSSACLHLIHYLVSGYGFDPDVTRCLDTRVFYICPRLNPDGAELALADKPRIIRSSTRPYPYDEDSIRGITEEDIDGDGRLLLMRVRDPNGPWKAHPQDTRLLMRREPSEIGGQYYRVFPEGRVKNYDGALVQVQPDKEGLDLNRNYPVNWQQLYLQPGAGPFPTSEPEIHAQVQFIGRHPNITGGVAYHTWSGVLLRPYGDQPDSKLVPEDLWTYNKIGQKGTQTTGYPAISVYHEFNYHPRHYRSGTFNDWLYDQQGAFGWVVEIWDPQKQAGIEGPFSIEWHREHPAEDDLKLIKWSDEKLGGKGFVNWYPYQHPELGEVELGGWNYLYAIRNPPPEFLEREIAPYARWLVWHLLISPCLELFSVSAKPLGTDTYHVRLVVQNTGWLPTYVTRMALEKKLVRGVVCEIELPEGASLETGEVRMELGQLEGRAYKASVPGGFNGLDSTDERAKVEWVVRAPQGGTVKLKARHERAGVVEAEVKLGQA